MPGTVNRRCHCKDPETRKELGSACPLRKQSKHGEWEYRDRLTASDGRRSYRRGGFTRRTDAEEHGRKVHNLIALAHDEPYDTARVGDLLFSLKRGAPLPEPDEIRRKLGLRGDLATSVTLASWLDQWLDAKKRLKESTQERYEIAVRLYLKPMLGHIPLDRLRAEHVDEMVDRIDEWNAEIADARAQGRQPEIENHTRLRYQVIKNNTIRRNLEVLRNALNHAIKKRRISPPNVLYAVDWPPPDDVETTVWSPQQVAEFLDFIDGKGQALRAMFQTVLFHGPRRGEVLGARWSDLDPATGILEIRKTRVSLVGRVVDSTPKTKAGRRVLHLDPATRDLLLALRASQDETKEALGEAYEDNDLIFCKPDGRPWFPDHVSRMWRNAVRKAGLPPLRLHEGRHTAATLALEAGIDIKIVSKRMGHSTTTFTQNRYQHVRPPVLDEASAKVIDLVERQRRRSGDAAGETG